MTQSDSTTLPITIAEGLPEPLQIAENLTNALAATMAPREIGNALVMALPDSYKLHDLTKQRADAELVAARKKHTAVLLDLASFITYVKDQAQPDFGYIYADPDARRFTAVFNDYRAIAVAGWRDQRATYTAALTPEFTKWLENSGKPKSQTEFAEFIEDNFADIVEPFAQQLLDVATTIQAKTDINFSSAKRLDNGQVQLGYTEVIDAKAGADGALTIPREFKLGLRLFKNGGGYHLKARLKYRLASGTVKFWYELDRPERAMEDAFMGYIEQVKTESGYSVLMGQA
jgi:uncharacterized protein YfdQ (DUF2303 family)